MVAFSIGVGISVMLVAGPYCVWARKLRKHSFLSATPFRALPSAFVFPGLQLIVLTVFLTGMTVNAVTVIASGQSRQCEGEVCKCRLYAYTALALSAIYLVVASTVLVWFNNGHSTATWQPAAPVASPEAVEDPIFD